MARHVTERTAAVVLDPAPVERMDLAAERALLRASEERVEIHALGRRFRRGPLLHALRPHRPVRPNLDLTHFAEEAGLIPFAHEADAVHRVTLITHLRDHAVQAGQTQELAGLAHGLRERLLHVNVFTQHDRHVGRQEMHVVRRRDADGIDLVIHLDEHLPEIGIKFRLRERLLELLEVVRDPLALRAPIDIAQRDDLFILVRHDITEAFAAAADLRDPHLGAGRDRPGLTGILS